jgi:cell division septation protein DedD
LPKSEEGEFELILGNRQLISVFLIVVVLLGVFFSMGYIVGRNSAAPAAEAAHNGGKTVPQEPPSSEPDQAAPSPAAAEKQPASNPVETVTPSASPSATHPEQTAPAAAPAPVKPAPVIAAKTKPTAVGPASGGLASITNEPAPGQYWQVVATTRPGAEVISEALTKKGFHALVTPASKEGFFRVLVGPFQDSSAQAEARTKLEAAGFTHSIVKRY